MKRFYEKVKSTIKEHEDAIIAVGIIVTIATVSFGLGKATGINKTLKNIALIAK